MPMLAVFRAFQGIGAGGIFALTSAVPGDIVLPRERAKYGGYSDRRVPGRGTARGRRLPAGTAAFP
jgi:MFS family permease